MNEADLLGESVCQPANNHVRGQSLTSPVRWSRGAVVTRTPDLRALAEG